MIAIARLADRLSMARAGGATTIDFEDESVLERLNALTGDKGPEECIDAVGLEAHATATIDSIHDRARQAVMLEGDRPHVPRGMAHVCRSARMFSVPGVHGGLIDRSPMGMVMNEGLTIRTGRPHAGRWTGDLLRRESGARRTARGRGFDRGDRRGLPEPADTMRGAARRDLTVPRDFARPPPLRPWGQAA